MRRVLLVAVLSVLVFAGLKPGKPPDRNALRARLLEGTGFAPEGGLVFEGPSRLSGETRLVGEQGRLSVELRLVLGPAPDWGNAEIFSLVDGYGGRPLVLGAWPEGLLLGSDYANPERRPERDRYVRFAFPERPVLISLVSDESGVRVFVDGRDIGLGLPAPPLPKEGIAGSLLLGSSGMKWRPWRGRMLELLVHSTALDAGTLRARAEGQPWRGDPPLVHYRFDLRHVQRSVDAADDLATSPGIRAVDAAKGGLVAPERVERIGSGWASLLAVDWRGMIESTWAPLELTLNVFGFVPLGLLIGWGRGRLGVLHALLAGLLFSLAFEVGQAFIPGRVSSGIDLVTNVLGAGLGGLLASGRPTPGLERDASGDDERAAREPG